MDARNGAYDLNHRSTKVRHCSGVFGLPEFALKPIKRAISGSEIHLARSSRSRSSTPNPTISNHSTRRTRPSVSRFSISRVI
jgi:hypothetical protein